MSENTTKTKSVSEIMESLDYVLSKLENLSKICGAVKALGDISDKHARTTLAEELSNQINTCDWYVRIAGDYVDDLEAALDREIHTIDKDEEVTTDDLPFK